MSMTEAEASPLYALLARQWRLPHAGEACAFDAGGASAAFALADGTLALASMADEESARNRWRVALDDGRATISPRARPVQPVTTVAIDVAPIRLAAFSNAGFLTGGASGRLVHVAPDGTVQALVDMDSGPVDVIGTGADGSAIVAAGGLVVRYDAEGGTTRALARYEEKLTALACSPDGPLIALGFEERLVLVPVSAEGAQARTFDLGPAVALAWSPDGRWLAAGLGTGGLALVEPDTARVLRLPDYPTPVTALDWSADSRWLATNGAFRAIVWAIGEPGSRPGTLETGRGGLVAASAVRLHPCKPLIATGFVNGMVVIAQPGRRDELVVREAGTEPVRDLSWSPDGERLALCCEGGAVAVVDLPPQMFK